MKTGDSVNVFRLSPAIAGSGSRYDCYLGLAPQALCLRLLRRLRGARYLSLGLVGSLTVLGSTVISCKRFATSGVWDSWAASS